MKMTNEHYNRLKILVEQTLSMNPNALQSYKDKNLTMMRYRWDLYHTATFKDRDLTSDLYKYLNDNNIDTALKAITGTN
jgi:hypothetical protein